MLVARAGVRVRVGLSGGVRASQPLWRATHLRLVVKHLLGQRSQQLDRRRAHGVVGLPVEAAGARRTSVTFWATRPTRLATVAAGEGFGQSALAGEGAWSCLGACSLLGART